MATGDFSRGVQELGRIAATDSGTRADLALIADRMQRRNYDEAFAAIAVLEKNQPKNPMVQNLRGAAYLGKFDPVAARKAFERALELDPTYLPAALNLV